MNVFIKYIGLTPADTREIAQICAMMKREGSYVDSVPYVDGLTVSDTEIYGKSIYATNVYDDDNKGALPGLAPLANTTTPYAWFARAAKVAVDAAGDPTKNVGVTFTVADTDSQAKLYWMQMGDANADRYFVAVGDYTTIIPASVELPVIDLSTLTDPDPSEMKLFEKTDKGYILTADTEAVEEKSYYAVDGFTPPVVV